MMHAHIYLTEEGAETLVKEYSLQPYHFRVRIVRDNEDEWTVESFKNCVLLTASPAVLSMPGSSEAVRAAMAGLDATIEAIKKRRDADIQQFIERKEQLKLIGFDGASVKVVE